MLRGWEVQAKGVGRSVSSILKIGLRGILSPEKIESFSVQNKQTPMWCMLQCLEKISQT